MFDGGPFYDFAAAVFDLFERFCSACGCGVWCLGAGVGSVVDGLLHFVGGPVAAVVYWESLLGVFE